MSAAVVVAPEPYGTPDATAMGERYRAELAERRVPMPRSDEPGATASEAFCAPRGAFLVARVRGEAAGCVGVRDIGGGAFELKQLWVEPAARNQGIGRALLASAEALAEELGAERLVLDTHSALTEAIGLYQSTGYEPTGAYNANPCADVWFSKVLAG